MAPLGPRAKKALRGLGYVAFGIFIAVMTLYITLPRNRIKEKIEATLSADPNSGTPGAINLEVILGDLGVTLFTGSGLRATDVVLRTRPTNPDDKPARFVLDDVSVKAGLIGLIFGRPTYRFRAHGFEGEVHGSVTSLPTDFALAINAKNIVLTGDKAIAQLVGLPIEGTVSCKIDVHADKGMLSALDGTAEIEIEDAVVGDGKAKLTIPSDPFLKAGITVPRMRLGTITVKVTFDKGKAKLESVHTKSPDGEAFVDGNAELRDFFNLSQLHLYIRFRAAEALTKREPTLELMTNQLASTSAKRPDGFFGFQLNGLISSLIPIPSPNPPPGVTLGAAPPTPTPTTPTTASKPVPAGFVAPPPSPGSNGDTMQPQPSAPTPPAPAPEPEAPQPPGPPPAPGTTTIAPPPGGRIVKVQPPAGEDPPAAPPATE